MAPIPDTNPRLPFEDEPLACNPRFKASRLANKARPSPDASSKAAPPLFDKSFFVDLDQCLRRRYILAIIDLIGGRNHNKILELIRIEDCRHLEKFLEKSGFVTDNIVKLAPREHYRKLDMLATHYVRSQPIRGIASLNLHILARSFQSSDCKYLGDVIQMDRSLAVVHAIVINRVRNPERLIRHFERILSPLSLTFGMVAPGWARPKDSRFFSLLEDRDARNKMEAKLSTINSCTKPKLIFSF